MRGIRRCPVAASIARRVGVSGRCQRREKPRPKMSTRANLRWRGWLAQLLLPLLLACILIRLTADRGPFWLGPNSDGSYQYLFNSLLVMNDLPPCHIIHPGTTVQTLGSLLLAMTTPGQGVEAMTDHVLAA